MATSTQQQKTLRRLPSVETLAGMAEGSPHALAVAAARLAIGELRARLLRGEDLDLSDPTLRGALIEQTERLLRSGPRPVINATGVILHTNLGRAPLAPTAAEAAALAGASYTDLEYESESGKRGERNSHVESSLCELTGAEAALAVNNNAAAVLLALAALASGKEVVVSRGHLIEIGGSFRIPDILAQSGARLVEVGTANRTRVDDYREAIGPDTAALLRVHRSNFQTAGFTEDASLDQMCELARDHDLAMIDDLGSGAIEAIGEEPTIATSISGAVTVACCSGDKLVGGPQAGLLLGRAEAIDRCRRHPLARALRIDKMQLAALGATIQLHRFGPSGAIPTLAMLQATPAELAERAQRLADAIGREASMVPASSPVGGGALPGVELEGAVCRVDPLSIGAGELAAALRRGSPPIVARVAEGRLILDPRTLEERDLGLVGELVRSALDRL